VTIKDERGKRTKEKTIMKMIVVSLLCESSSRETNQQL
jgi:hypothetical protein